MPNVYSAPEVIRKSNWGYEVAWDIVSPRTLINGKNTNGVFDVRVHMADRTGCPARPSATQIPGTEASMFGLLGRVGQLEGLRPDSRH
ncbi:hypothetical protein E8E15_005958 [Penicillium rubens]|nr:hypothetical protein E8E15_005958 [Penicillium rubens]